jgi:hypothetical protein
MDTISLTFLLGSGRRRTMTFEGEATIARVKELVWNAWPTGNSNTSHWFYLALILADWQDEHPPTPSYLRILHLGKILQDDDTLSSMSFFLFLSSTQSSLTPFTALSFPVMPASTIVHLAIRPYAVQPQDDAPKKKGRHRRTTTTDTDSPTTPGSSCCSSCTIC